MTCEGLFESPQLTCPIKIGMFDEAVVSMVTANGNGGVRSRHAAAKCLQFRRVLHPAAGKLGL